MRRDGEKAVAQKALRRKTQKHAKSQAYIAASKILAEQNERKIGTASLKSVEHSTNREMFADRIFCWLP